MQKYCNETWKNVVEMLGGDIYVGLSSEESLKRRKNYGDNKIDLPGSNNIISEIIKSFLRIYILISVGILAFCIYKEQVIMAIICGTMLIITLSIKLLYLYNNRKEIGYLQGINNSTVRVIRDGKEQLLKSADLVKGDIVYFKKSSLIAADMRIINADNIKVDEKNITGENFIKEKFESKMEANISNIGEMGNILFKGSIIKGGEGYGIVVETGEETQLGKLLAMLVFANNKHVIGLKLEKTISKMMIVILSLIVVISIAISLYSKNLDNLLLSLVITQTIPGSIIMILYCIILKKDLKSKGIDLINVSTLDSIEDIEYLFLDKIGSITKEEVHVKKIFTDDTLYSEDEVEYEKDINIIRILDIVLLCNDAFYNIEDDTGTGDLLEIGYLRFASKKKIYKSILNNKYKRIFQIPMESEKRMLTTLNRYKKGYRANVRGNVDDVLENCKFIMVDGIEKEMTQEDEEKIRAIDFNLSVEGLIAQGIAYRSFSYQPSLSENIESNLVFVGIIALENTFNESIEEDMAHIKEKNITPIIFTEDNKIAAFALGKKAGIITNTGGVISGVELNSLNKEEFTKILAKVRVFARVTPEIKGKIVGMFTRENRNVASSGESLGDLPILSISKIGIGKGKASQMVRMLSDIFIKENYLKGFLKMFDVAKVFKVGLKAEKSFIVTLIISEILIVNLLQFIRFGEKFGLLSVVLINILIFIPLSLIILNSREQTTSNKKNILRIILWTSLSLFSVYNITEGYNEMLFFILSFMLIEQSAIATNISFKRLSRELLLLLITIILMIAAMSLLMFQNSINFESYEIIRSIIIIVLYGIIELIIKKWQ